LESAKVFVGASAPSSSIPREFVRYRCMVEREAVKQAVEKIGQTNLKKWLNKAQ
jgi:origin recognition complex subunit 4